MSIVVLFVIQLERSFKFMRETEDQLKVIPQFCFPDAKDWAPIDNFPRSAAQCLKPKGSFRNWQKLPDARCQETRV